MTSDLRRTLRALRRAPAFTVSAALCIALAVGASTAIYSVISGILLRPLPYPDEARVMAVWEQNSATNDRNVVSPANFIDWRAGTTAFSAMGASVAGDAALQGERGAEQVRVEYATPGVFQALGTRPALGRVINEKDAEVGTEDVVLLGDALWRTRFGARADVVGTLVTIDGTPTRIIGVMPPDFRTIEGDVQMWQAFPIVPGRDYRRTAGRFMKVVARLAPGVTEERAERELRTIARRLEQQHPDFNGKWTVNVLPIREQIVGAVQRPLLVLAGAVALVLLIACANVANLMLVRTTARQQELAVSAALGAGRGRVAGQLLTESLLIAGLGGAVGVIGAVAAVRALVRSAPDVPRIDAVGVDPRVLLFSVAVTLGTGIVFGLVPALATGRRLDLASTLRQGGRGGIGGGTRARTLLTGAQIALSLVLLVGAGLLLKSFARLMDEDPGFRAEQVVTATMMAPPARYKGDTARVALYERVRERLAAIPGVQEVGYISRLPISGGESANDIVPEGLDPSTPPSDRPLAAVRAASPGYFRAMRIPLKRGTLYGDDLVRGAPVHDIVISETAARLYWPGQDPIGKTADMEWDFPRHARVVGVVGDVRAMGLDSLPKPMTYWSPQQFEVGAMTFTVRAATGTAGIEQAMRRAVAELEPGMPLGDLKTMEATVAESVARRRLTTTLVTAFGVVALVLAAVGLYGVVAYGVAARTREFGVRVALGARGADVSRLVLRHGLRVAAASALVGGAAALAATRLVAASLYGTAPTDASVFALSIGTLVLVALVASWLPARRAARTDPVTALRAE